MALPIASFEKLWRMLFLWGPVKTDATLRKLAAILSLMLVATGIAGSALGQSGDSARDLFEQLDDQSFASRDAASRELANRGIAILPAIREAMTDASRERTVRSLDVVRSFAMSSDPKTKAQAMDFLKELGQESDLPFVSRRAKRIRDELVYRERRQVIDRLSNSGAKFSFQTIPLNGQLVKAELSLIIDDDWFGDVEDLKLIEVLDLLQTVELNHPSVDDTVVSCIESHTRIQKLTLKRAKITNSSLTTIEKLSSLQSLSLIYCPLNDESIDQLFELTGLTELRLIGTQISRSSETAIANQIGASVDIRKGGYLGFRYQRGSPTCLVTAVVSGSVAEAAGLKAGDTITEFRGTPISAPEGLIEILKDMDIGDEARMLFKRDEESFDVKVKLGPWIAK